MKNNENRLKYQYERPFKLVERIQKEGHAICWEAGSQWEGSLQSMEANRIIAGLRLIENLG